MVNTFNITDRINTLDQNESATKSMDKYNEASSMQLKWIKLGRKNIEHAVSLFHEYSDTLKVVDFACSHGKNSMAVINQLFDELVEKRPHLVKKIKSIGIYHNDLPDNDFDEISLLATCIGKTYYEKIVENETVDFGFCYTSLHWMPEYRGLTYGLVYEELYEHRILTKWFDEMSDRHILSWLDLRYQELKHSALISFNICTMTNFSDIVNKGWESLIKIRGLNPGALANVTIPVYFRSKKQVNKSLEAVKDIFKVIHIEYMLDEASMDRSTLRAVTYNQLLSGLSKYPIYLQVKNL